MFNYQRASAPYQVNLNMIQGSDQEELTWAVPGGAPAGPAEVGGENPGR